jgi:hypothetical protein
MLLLPFLANLLDPWELVWQFPDLPVYMRLQSALIHAFLVLVHPLFSLHYLSPLVHLSLEHPSVVLLPLLHHVLRVLLSLLLCEGINLRLLELHLLHGHLVPLNLIVLVNLLPEAQVLGSLGLRPILQVSDLPGFRSPLRLRLVDLVVEEEETLFFRVKRQTILVFVRL